ncbi:MAG: saccharopine dehydrogenase NADP-binding domain-containing protein [Bacteroidales bacterium]|nr:saccharopine dehydrogenase NADP-binding domain-containing protein [Bacteroidales bacterium]
MKKVLILGSGLVARPIIRYLLKKNFFVTVASNTPDRALEMIDGNPHGTVVDWDASAESQLDAMIAAHDITVSLLPFGYHVGVATLCLKNRKSMVTTSYVKPEMKALDAAAREAGVILLNELGLDPGIDHMSAMRIIDHIHNNEGAVLEFYSFCGALPAPEAADNPFKYKFTWSPKGVLMAGNNDGVYLRHGEIINVPTEDLFKNPILIECPQVGTLEVYPNRDSLAYKDLYGIPETRTLYRGTLRNQDWCGILDYMKTIGLFSYDPIDMTGMTYADLLSRQLAVGSGQSATDHRISTSAHQHITTSLKWLGLFDTTPMNRSQASPFDVVSDLMIGKMSLKENERDMVVMQHTFLAGYSDGRKEVIRSRMLDFGIPGDDTAVARTVALPAAIGVEMILNGEIPATGVHIPVIPEIYTPILNQLEAMGIRMEEEFGLPVSENIQ